MRGRCFIKHLENMFYHWPSLWSNSITKEIFKLKDSLYMTHSQVLSQLKYFIIIWSIFYRLYEQTILCICVSEIIIFSTSLIGVVQILFLIVFRLREIYILEIHMDSRSIAIFTRALSPCLSHLAPRDRTADLEKFTGIVALDRSRFPETPFLSIRLSLASITAFRSRVSFSKLLCC